MKVIFQNVLGVLTSIGNFIKKLLLIIANWLFTIPNTPDKSSLITIINISITGFILLITLSIYPFQKISETLSGNFYNYFLTNKKFKTPLIINLCICLFEIIIYPFVPDCKFFLILYIACLIILLVNIFKYSHAIKEQLDLTKSCYPIIEENLKKEIEEIQKTELEMKNNPKIAYNEARELLIDALFFQSDVDKFPLGKPIQGYDKIFIYKIHNVYDLLYDALEKLNYSTYEKAVECLFNCLKSYFSYIENHSIVVDNVFLDFLDISKIIIDKSSEKNNKLYLDIYLGSLKLLVDDLSKLNINKDFYYSKLIDFYAINVTTYDKQYLNVGLSKVAELEVLIFKQKEFLQESFESYYSYLINYRNIIYKTKNAYNWSSINQLINCFCFDCFSNTKYFFNKDITNKLFELQKSISTINTTFQIPGLNDFSTTIPIKGVDKTISALICLLISNSDYNGKNINYKINIINRLIEILENRYLSKGLHLEGIISQLFKIYVNIVSLFDPYLFVLFNAYSKNYVPLSDNEKKQYFSIIENILVFYISKGKIGKEDILFTELKLFMFVLLCNNYSSLKNYIQKNRKKIIKYFVINKNISEELKIEIYRIVKNIATKNEKEYLLKKLHRFYKKIKIEKQYFESQGLSNFIKYSYDKNIFTLDSINVFPPLFNKIKEYINFLILDYGIFKKNQYKNDVLKLPKKTKLEDIHKYLNKIEIQALSFILFELQLEAKIEIDKKYIIIL